MAAVEVVRQFLTNFERKQRNLMKRKGKLDVYREQLNRGEALNEEQKKAVESYEGVLHSLNVVQEFLLQAKDLMSEVEKCTEVDVRQKEAEHEDYTRSFLHTHICIMKLLNSLDNPELRAAVTKASSENSLKLLDIVRRLLHPSLPEHWPTINTSALANIPTILQSDSNLGLASQYAMDLVLGRSNAVPIPDDYEGSHKRFNFKEARNICFRLLASPSVRRVLEPSNSSASVPSSVSCEPEKTTIDSGTTHGEFHPRPEVNQIDASALPELNTTSGLPTSDNQYTSIPTTPSILDQVIKPLGGTFNFLQASSVIASDNAVDVRSHCVEPSTIPQVNHDIPVAIENFIHEQKTCFEPPPSDSTSAVVYDSEPKPSMNLSAASRHLDTDRMQQTERDSVTEPEVSIQSKPLSYADLVRRSGYNRPTHQQEHYVPGPTHEMRKADPVVEQQSVHDSGDAEGTQNPPGWNRGSRGYNRGSNRGSSRRPGGGARWHRPGMGRGGVHYRGAPTVAQSSC